MQTNTALGVGLGKLIASAFNPGNQGTLDGMRVNELQSQLRLQDAQRRKVEREADNLAAEANMRNPDSIIETLLKASGAGGKTAVNDFKAYLDGGKLPSTALPGSASALLDGSNTIEPTYVKRFPQLAQRYGALRESLMLGNKDPDKMEQSIGQGQRNRITETITPKNAVDVALMTAAMDGKDPTQVAEASLVNRLANGGDYGTIAPAILASKGKGRFDEFNGGALDVVSGQQNLNPIGTSMVTENNAKANQANAGAKENLAQAVLAGVRGENIKAGKGDGSQATQRDMAQLRDDIRSDYNVQYPINSLNGQRPKNAPSFDQFTRDWLKTYNIDEGDYFRSTGSPGSVKMTHDGFPARQNPDGSYSTEISITVTDPKINGGKPTNIPSLWEGREVDQATAIKKAIASGKKYQSFATIKEAVEAAVARSKAGGASAQPKIDKLPAGAKQIGTSKGKPVYQTPDGKKFIGE